MLFGHALCLIRGSGMLGPGMWSCLIHDPACLTRTSGRPDPKSGVPDSQSGLSNPRFGMTKSVLDMVNEIAQMLFTQNQTAIIRNRENCPRTSGGCGLLRLAKLCCETAEQVHRVFVPHNPLNAAELHSAGHR